MPKHILILMTDQCRADAIGAYGNEYAQTPALDALAADSPELQYFMEHFLGGYGLTVDEL